MNNLTIEDIHRIRREHAASTQNMQFDEYKADLQNEIKPILELLKSMKVDKKSEWSYCAEKELPIVAQYQGVY